MLTAERLREVLRYDAATGVFRWHIKPCHQMNAGDVAGAKHCAGYVQMRVLGRVYLAHRLAWLYVTNQWPEGLIDHANGDRSDNRFSNLRLVTRSQNAANASCHRDSASKIKGVYWSRQRHRWRAEICVSGRRIHIGLYDSKDAAAAAYSAAATQHFGEYARSSCSS